MDNNDRLIRLRYALDIKNTDMIEIFKLGGVKVTIDELAKILTKTKEAYDEFGNEIEVESDNTPCTNDMLESFLNGFIIFKRGKQEPKPGQAETPVLKTMNHRNVNNVLLKKVKIALELSSEDMLDTLKEAGVIISKGELSAVFRKEGHKNYKECGDRYARNFLKGLAIKHRGLDN